MTAVVDKIVRVTEAQATFWSRAHGWAPTAAAGLLSKSRLDRQCSLARTLKDYAKRPLSNEEDARLILAYVTLRTLSEGTLKLFFSVWYSDYSADVDAIMKRGKRLDPDGAAFDPLIKLFEMKTSGRWTRLLRRIQARGNAIHAFKDRPLGSFSELRATIKGYGDFLIDTDNRLPYPDADFAPFRA